MKEINSKEFIAKRVSQELKMGDVVNLGIGLPTLVSNYIKPENNIIFQSENGIIHMASIDNANNPDIVNAGGERVNITAKGSFIDSFSSFSMIRGGHIDVCVLGALEVDQEGNLASWIIPGKKVPGMGGAMDLVIGSKKVIIAMQHLARGKVKILKKCTLPLTAVKVVDLIITEYCVLKPIGAAMEILEINKNTTVEEIMRITDANLVVSSCLKIMHE